MKKFVSLILAALLALSGGAFAVLGEEVEIELEEKAIITELQIEPFPLEINETLMLQSYDGSDDSQQLKENNQAIVSNSDPFKIENGVLTVFYGGTGDNVVIPDGVIAIDDYVFSRRGWIKKYIYQAVLLV